MGSGSFWLPEQASTLASEIDWLFQFVTWTSIVLFVGVVSAMIYFAVRYRRRSDDDQPVLVEENKLLEISWIVVPTILVLLVFTWGFQTFIKIGVAPPDAYLINVRGWQWNWEFEYPNGVTSDELHVPVDRPIRLRMSSDDVIHSLFIPAFRVKQDVLPNRYTSVWFEATVQDTFDIFCTEYCGTQHSGMSKKVIVESQEAFEEWLASGGGLADLPPVELGELLYTQQGCQACHSLDGSPMSGPTWQGLYGTTGREMADGSTVTVDENYLRTAIVAPGEQIVAGYENVMPAVYSDLSERDLNGLIQFIRAQSDQPVPEGDPPAGVAASDSTGAASDSTGAGGEAAAETAAETAAEGAGGS